MLLENIHVHIILSRKGVNHYVHGHAQCVYNYVYIIMYCTIIQMSNIQGHVQSCTQLLFVFLLFSLSVVEEVARFDVSVNDVVGVDVSQGQEQRPHVLPHLLHTNGREIVLEEKGKKVRRKGKGGEGGEKRR